MGMSWAFYWEERLGILDFSHTEYFLKLFHIYRVIFVFSKMYNSSNRKGWFGEHLLPKQHSSQHLIQKCGQDDLFMYVLHLVHIVTQPNA